MECGVPITGRISLSDPCMEIRILTTGNCLTLINKGPYADLHEAWSRIGEPVQRSGSFRSPAHTAKRISMIPAGLQKLNC